jgi:hypothetical protein
MHLASMGDGKYGEDETGAVCDIRWPKAAGSIRACYIALDGHPTMMRSKAARFSGFPDAKAFAEEKRITLNSHTYIGLEDFTAVELKGYGPFNHSGAEKGDTS